MATAVVVACVALVPVMALARNITCGDGVVGVDHAYVSS